MRVRWPPRGMPCCTLNFAASRSPCVPFIVTEMKPVVHVPWYQVLPWILSGGADS
jgi:hypothetical protein